MNQKSLKITTGAMVTAIFGVLLLLNRQTGNLFEEFFLFLYPIPLVAFSAMYGAKSSLPVLVAMSLISFLFGSFTTIFYAVSQASIGLLFGCCLYHKVDMTKTLFAVMILSAIVSVLNTVVLGFLFGFDLNQEVAEMQNMMNSIFEQAGAAVPKEVLSANYLKQMLVISMTLMGALQGFIVYEISLLILRRLRFPVQKPKSVYLYAPPKWTGCLALLSFFGYTAKLAQPFENELLQNTVLTVGILGYIYLLCFGFIAILLILKIRFPKIGILGGILGLLGIFVFPMLVIIAGFLYIVRYHQRFIEIYPLS
ncbi:MAG: YybS family protein [Lachnospiraceae bacterium]|nr:YybS family protein [Lachnospiraceae bacterium]